MLLKKNSENLSDKKKDILVIVPDIKSQSHTFIRREIFALKKLKVPYKLYSIHNEDNSDFGGFGSIYPINILEIILENIFLFIKKPKKYFKCLKIALSDDNSFFSKFISLWHMFASSKLSFFILKNNIGFIHAHFLNVSSSIALFSSIMTDIPLSITIHSAGIKNVLGNRLVKEKLRYAKVIFCVSNLIQKELKNIGRTKNIYVIHCGVFIDYKDIIYQKKESKKTHIKKRVLFIGRLCEKKGVKNLLYASKDEHWKLIIAGYGKQKKELKTISKKLKLDVDFLGKVNENKIKELLENSDVLVVPSITAKSGEKEGIPVVIMEAFNQGIPVIASDHSGISEIIDDENVGILIKEGNIFQLKKAIIKVLNEKHHIDSNMQIRKLKMDFDVLKETKKKYDLLKETKKIGYIRKNKKKRDI